MPSYEMHVTTQQLSDMLADLDQLPQAPVGEHVDEETLLEYVTENLASVSREAVQAHLASCLACATLACDLLDVAEPWLGQAGAARLHALRQRQPADDTWQAALEALRTFLDSLRFDMPMTPAAARRAGHARMDQRRTDRRGFAARLAGTTDGGARWRLTARAPELEGQEILLRIGDRSWRGALGPDAQRPGELVLEFRVTAAELADVPPESTILAFLPPEPPSSQAG